MNKLKLHWAVEPKNPVANVLGYATHNAMLKKYGEQYFDYTPDADVVFHIISAEWFRPLLNKKNVLLTMWEFNQVPETYKEAFKYADLIIVPSSYCREIFRKVTDKPIEVCWEGVEKHRFPFYQRKYPGSGEKFRFLWVGAPNERKGYPLVLEAVKMIEANSEHFKNVEIYMKTTMEQKINWGKWIKINSKRLWNFLRGNKDAWQQILLSTKANLYKHKKVQLERYGKYKNIIFDRRKLSFDELVALYNSAHCFILPTFGEGWGLTLCEALATGAPCISADYTGCKDFFDRDVGYPIKYRLEKTYLKNYGITTEVHIPDTQDFIKKMMYVIYNYSEALKKGKRGSERIHSKFTWANSAKRLYEIIRRYYGADS